MFTFLGLNSFGGIQYPVFIVVVVAVVLQLVLSYTVFGSHIYGVGGNPRCRAAVLVCSVDRVVVITFVITGVACGIGGLLDASMTSQGSATNILGDNLALQAIAGVALGGTSIFGGVGSVWRTIVGVLMLGMITNGFNLLEVPSFWQDIVRGLLIVVAVVISTSVGRLGSAPALGES